jgi:transcriptional regulator with XRE-family HTH domain
MTMTPDPLNFLVELREAAGLTQKEVARRFDLADRQGYKSVAAWEKGESVPKDRLRARFLRYLWDDLRLHKEPERFAECWEILVERWHWEPLSDAERISLHLPPLSPGQADAPDVLPLPTTTIAASAIQGNVTTQGGAFAGSDQYNFYGLPQIEHFVKQYRTAQDTLDEPTFAAQLASYLRWVIERTENIELRGVKLRDGSQTTALKLAEVYVTLNAELVGGHRRNKPDELALEQLLTTGNRLAVIGGPGCGKTTVLIYYMAWVLANAIVNNNPALATAGLGLRVDEKQPTLPLPIYLPLSVYARQRFGHDPQQPDSEETLADFLPKYLHRIAASLKQLPTDFFERLLTSGRHVLLLLDGLDEVADEGQRRLVREAIENLVTSREQLRVAVTCRTVAFQGRTVLARGFRQVNVRPLTEEQVRLLIRKAYEYQYRDDLLEQQRKISELLAGLEKLEAEHARRGPKDTHRLINTPLLVRMLLVVHLSDRKLPQHRAELYKRFADTIVHADYAFDESVAEAMRKLAGNSPELLRSLAFGMHHRGEQQGREIDEHDPAILN